MAVKKKTKKIQRTTISVSSVLQNKLREYCNSKGYRVSAFAEAAIWEYINLEKTL